MPSRHVCPDWDRPAKDVLSVWRAGTQSWAARRPGRQPGAAGPAHIVADIVGVIDPCRIYSAVVPPEAQGLGRRHAGVALIIAGLPAAPVVPWEARVAPAIAGLAAHREPAGASWAGSHQAELGAGGASAGMAPRAAHAADWHAVSLSMHVPCLQVSQVCLYTLATT